MSIWNTSLLEKKREDSLLGGFNGFDMIGTDVSVSCGQQSSGINPYRTSRDGLAFFKKELWEEQRRGFLHAHRVYVRQAPKNE